MFSVVPFKGGFAEGGSHYPHLKLSEGFSYTFWRRSFALTFFTLFFTALLRQLFHQNRNRNFLREILKRARNYSFC